MRIAILQDYLRSGGTERQSLLLADAFALHGHSSRLICFRPNGPLRAELRLAEYVALQAFDLGLDWFAPGLIRQLKDFKPDIILCMGRMANAKAWKLRIEIPDALLICTLRTGRPLTRSFVRSLKSAHGIVANSRAGAEARIRALSLNPSHVRVIHNALVFANTSHPIDPQSLRSQLGANAPTSVLLNVGMFRASKGQERLIELCAGLPKEFDWQLWLVGDGERRTACEELAKKLHLQTRIHFLGWLRDPSQAYDSADIAVHASHSEGLSNFLIEAQSHGLCCVALDAQGNEECLVEGRTGWVIPQDQPEAFTKRLVALASEPREQREARAQEARHFARTRFDPESQVSAYLAYFKELLEAKASGE